MSPSSAGRRRFALVAGEASGDLLGAGLVAALRERFPAAEFAGIGGPQMRAAGMSLWHDAAELAVMGLVEVLRHLPRLLAIRRDAAHRALEFRPDAFIGIDAPDFNLGLERKLKRAGLRTVHYVSPSVWAWREKRAERIGRSADLVLCLFPMEPAIYARHGVEARFVGHPLADAFALDPDQEAARRQLDLPADAPVLALLPGSRLGEIARLGGDFLAAAGILAARIPNLQVVAPMAGEACRDAFLGLRAGRTELQDLIPDSRFSTPLGDAHTALLAADAVLLASGTAALEAMLAKRPMAVAYRLAPWTYRIVRGLGLLKVDHYALPNVLAGREIVPELMQDDCNPAALAAALAPALAARRIDPELLAEYRRQHERLRQDASRRAAAEISALLPGGAA